MMLLLNAIARLVEIALMAAIALLGLGVGLYCLSGLISLGAARPDRLLHLPSVRAHIGHFLAQMSASGPVAVLAVVAGVVAVIIGLLLIVGVVGSRREHLLVLDNDGDGGSLLVRPRPIRDLLRAETETAPGVTGTRRVKVKLSRSGQRGKARITASRGLDPDAATVDRTVHDRIDPIAERFHLGTDIRVRLDEPKPAEVESS